jgi:hypothetical protein
MTDMATTYSTSPEDGRLVVSGSNEIHDMYISEEGDKLIAVLHIGQDDGPVLFMRAIYNWEADE